MSIKLMSKRLPILLLAPALILASLLFISCGIYGGNLPPLPKKTGLAAFQGPSLLVDAAYVYQRIGRNGVKIIDVRSQDEYTSGHLTSAINIPARFWRTPMTAQVFHEAGDALKPFDPTRYEGFLGDRGISENDELIVYGNPRMLTESVVPVLILDWLGHRRLHFFDGEATEIWSRAGQPLDRQQAAFGRLTNYRANPKPEALVNKQQMLELLAGANGNCVIWDCRSREEYDGSVRLRDVKRAGHLPRAVHLDYMQLYLDSPLFQTRGLSELQIRLESVGIEPKKQIVIYSHDGSRAAYAYLVLRMMNYPRVAVYEHSWLEWGNGDDLIVKGFTGEPEVLNRPPRKQLQLPTLYFSGSRTFRW